MAECSDTEFQYAEMVYLDNPTANYASWKRETEGLIGRELEPIEATTMYDLISGRTPNV